MSETSKTSLLASLTISAWRARRSSRAAAEAAEAVTRAEGICSTVPLLRGPEIERIYKLGRKYRHEFDRRTLPWGRDGWRLVPPRFVNELIHLVPAWRGEYDEAVNKFLLRYDDLIQAAKGHLGDLYDPSHYPSREVIAGLFGLDVELRPVDPSDSLPADVRQAVEASLERQHAAGTRRALEHVVEEIDGVVRALNPKDRTARSDTIERARALAESLPALAWDEDSRAAFTAAATRLSRAVQQAEAGRPTEADAADPARDLLKGWA